MYYHKAPNHTTLGGAANFCLQKFLTGLAELVYFILFLCVCVPQSSFILFSFIFVYILFYCSFLLFNYLLIFYLYRL